MKVINICNKCHDELREIIAKSPMVALLPEAEREQAITDIVRDIEQHQLLITRSANNVPV